MKKLYKLISYKQSPAGFTLEGDVEQVFTPLGKPASLPTQALAEAVCAEWRCQGKTIQKETLPLTRIAYIALDVLSDPEQRAVTIEQLLSYGETDLVCYRAGDNPALFCEQAELLDPVQAWAEDRFGIALNVTQGLMPVAQPAKNRQKLAQLLSDYDDWKLAALTASVGPLGSLIIALALVEGYVDAQAAFRLSHLEELYETQKWGEDEEKEKRMRNVKKEIESVGVFLSFLLSSENRQ